MKVILLSDIDGLGKTDDIVDVNDGYARNFLLKKKMAVEATASNLNTVRVRKGAKAERERREKQEALDLASKLSEKKVALTLKAGEGGKLYGAATSADISEGLKLLGFVVDKKNVLLKNPIKNAGEHEISVKLHPEVTVQITVEIRAGS